MNLEFKFIYLKREKKKWWIGCLSHSDDASSSGQLRFIFFSLNNRLMFTQQMAVNRTVSFFFVRNSFGNGNRKWLPVERATHTKKKYKRKGMIRKNVSSVQILKNPPGAPSLSHNHKRILFCRLDFFFFSFKFQS